MAQPSKPRDVMVANGWFLNLPVGGINTNGHFETIEGISRQTGVVEVVDGGTNKKHKFSDQLVDYGEMTLTRPYDASNIDRAMENLLTTMIETGVKVNATAIKLHNGVEVMRVIFTGFAFNGEAHPTWDVSSGDKFMMSYSAHCDSWEVLPSSIQK